MTVCSQLDLSHTVELHGTHNATRRPLRDLHSCIKSSSFSSSSKVNSSLSKICCEQRHGAPHSITAGRQPGQPSS